jgi:hypothetical protein
LDVALRIRVDFGFLLDPNFAAPSPDGEGKVAEKSRDNISPTSSAEWGVTPCGSCETDVSEELSVSIIRVTRVGELGTLT